MVRIWIYLINTFLVCSETSYRLAVRISAKHDAALQAAALGLDAFFVNMYAYYHPIHLALVAAYNEWKAQGGTQESQTLSLAQMLRLLSGTKAELWMTAVKQFYPLGSIRFKELFPDLKKVYQNGPQLERINAIAAFLLAIGSDVNLAALKIQVQLFYDQIHGAYLTQQGSISTTGVKSEAIETAREASAVGQFADYGGLIQKFASNPNVVGNYFDERALRDGNQVIFHHKIKKATVYTFCKHTAAPTDEITLENESAVPIIYGFVLHKGDRPGAKSVTVPAMSNMTVHADALTDDLVNNHQFVGYNADLLLDAETTIEFV